jgi:hypothetical protein
MIGNPFGAGFRLVALGLLVATVLCWQGSSRPALAQAESLNFVGDPLKLQIKKGEEEIPVKVTVRNSSDRKIDLKFSAKVRDSEGNPQPVIKIPTDASVKRYSVTRVDLTIAKDDAIPKDDASRPSMPLKGFLVVSDEQKKVAPGTLPVTLTEPKVLPANILGISFEVPWLVVVAVAPGVLALLLVIFDSRKVIFNTFRRKDKRNPTTPRLFSTLGTGLALKFGEGGSWAAVVVVVAAILQAFTAAAVYPEERAYFSAQQMAGFVLFFAVLIGFAPFLYNAFRFKQKDALADPKSVAKPLKKAPEANLSEPATDTQRQGYVLTLLMTSALVIWALIGQLSVAFLLVLQIESTTMPVTTKVLLESILILSGLYAIYYAWTSIHETLERKLKRLARKEKVRKDLKKENEKKLSELEIENEKKLIELAEENAEELKNIAVKDAEEREKLEKVHAKKLDELKKENEKKLRKLKKEHAKKLEEFRKKYSTREEGLSLM